MKPCARYKPWKDEAEFNSQRLHLAQVPYPVDHCHKVCNKFVIPKQLPVRAGPDLAQLSPFGVADPPVQPVSAVFDQF